MSVMEFILVAHAIIVGLAVAEVLRGFADLIRSEQTRGSLRLNLIAAWTLLLLLQVWWAIWRVGNREVWTFPEFMIFLLPVAILYVIARLCYPVQMAGADLNAYYRRVARVIWMLVAATYLSFALLLQPFVFGGIVLPVFVSQIGVAILALLATRIESRGYHLFVIAAMFAQVVWRGFSSVIGN